MSFLPREEKDIRAYTPPSEAAGIFDQNIKKWKK